MNQIEHHLKIKYTDVDKFIQVMPIYFKYSTKKKEFKLLIKQLIPGTQIVVERTHSPGTYYQLFSSVYSFKQHSYLNHLNTKYYVKEVDYLRHFSPICAIL